MQSRNMKDRVQARFAEVAENYRSSAVHAGGVDLETLVGCANAVSESVVLDAGCGAGHTAMAFAPLVQSVIACDFTPSMLRQVEALAEERGIQNVTTKLADVERLPFPDASFDIIASRYSAHHWSRPERALREFRRTLKGEGCIVISDIMSSEDYAQDTFLQALELLRDPSHIRDYRISEWRRMLAAAGFESEVIYRFRLRLHFATWIKRMATPRQNADMIRSLFDGASADIRAAFELPDRIESDDFHFRIPGAVVRALPAPFGK